MTQDSEKTAMSLPLIPLRDVVVYPQMVIPLFVGREKSVRAIHVAAEQNAKKILLVAQHEAEEDTPDISKLYQTGTLATILQFLKLPDGTLKILVEGQERVTLDNIRGEDDKYLLADYQLLPESRPEETDSEALLNTLKQELEEYASLSKKLPREVLSSLKDISDVSVLADSVAMHMPFDLEVKQQILEHTDVAERVEAILGLVDSEVDLQKVEKRIRSRVKKQMERSQREYYLNEQMKAIQKELGDIDSDANEFSQLEQRIEDAKMPAKAREKADAELAKLKMMSPMSAEASVIRNYIDWMVSVPWETKSRVKLDIKKASEQLDKDHYGLKEVKERILEFLAVQKRVRKLKGPILCLVGPPGVGKTSLGESIAKTTNRKFARMSLGGVRDEAEIRGHRRTYIGSMPGKLVQKLSKIGVKNPLFLLDEIDKMGMDYRGDPASALLEVLDPEQNTSFNDHYLEVDFDLSEVMFICTANSMNIPAPLLDRMEVIRIPGYTEDEKLAIARKYLLPKQAKANGLKKNELELTDDAILGVIREYTREAGVRGLERNLAKLCRKIVTKNVKAKPIKTTKVGLSDLHDLLGVAPYTYGIADEENRVGQVNGLAWTSVGGELLTIEASSIPGTGKMVKTGSLGDVMQESIQAALTVVRGRSASLGIAADFHTTRDLHVHIPEGATPKDGPSAGVGICTAMVSELTGVPVRADVAMTGEITLRGEVLSIGGVKEKLLAAHRAGIKTVIIPEGNLKNISEIPEKIKQDFEIVTARWIDQVLDVALESSAKITEESSETELREASKTDKKSTVRPSTH
jgi:ATP-dependent Lon protease